MINDIRAYPDPTPSRSLIPAVSAVLELLRGAFGIEADAFGLGTVEQCVARRLEEPSELHGPGTYEESGPFAKARESGNPEPIGEPSVESLGAYSAYVERVMHDRPELDALYREVLVAELRATKASFQAAVSELQQERSLLESLLSNVPDAIYFKDATGKVIRANQAMATRLGLSDPREAVGKTGLEMPNAPALLALHEDDEAVLRSGEPQRERLERRERPGGSFEWSLVTRQPIRDRCGGITGIIDVFHDVTEQKNAEEKIQEAIRRRDQFLAMLSHELRNPLGAIVTATSILKKQLAGSDHARPLDVLQRQSLQMARLLDDLLEANRVTENKIELRKETLDLRRVVRDAAEASRATLESRGISFTVDTDEAHGATDVSAGAEGEPADAHDLWVDGDAARLHQIQMNLLHNAAKYTPSGGHVALTLRREGREAVLRVHDDGAGIPTDMLEKVFELFAQAGRTLDRSQGGVGVGLMLVRSLVGLHGGRVSAESAGEGKGADFIVRLPLATSPVDATARAGEKAPAPGSRTSSARLPRHAKIAIVEDNPDSREMLVEALSNEGFDCQSADNGIDGLAMIESVRPDVAIIDVGLPSMNGFELARRIRAEPRHAMTRLVALTGYGMRDDRERALAAGFDDHLVKPIDPAALVRCLERGSN